MGEQGEIIMTGRLDAAQCDRALQFMDGVPAPRVVDLAGLGNEFELGQVRKSGMSVHSE